MPHLYDNIPAMLRQRPNWVVWGIRDAPPDVSPKSPYNPASLLSGRPLPAKAGERRTWSSYQNAVECVRRGLARGIGYEFPLRITAKRNTTLQRNTALIYSV